MDSRRTCACWAIIVVATGCSSTGSGPASGGQAGNAGAAQSTGGGSPGGTSGLGGGAGSANAGASGAAAGNGGSSAGGAGGAAASRRVFVSSETFVPTFGSLDAADGECGRLAAAQTLGGTWRAWLSDSTGSPSTRFVQSALPYVSITGTLIAADWSDLTDGTIATPIDHDETGAALDSTAITIVWTGTNTNGAPGLGNCSDWSTTGSGAGYGSALATDATWTLETGNLCTALDRLYCFEQ